MTKSIMRNTRFDPTSFTLLLTPRLPYTVLGNDKARQAAYRELFPTHYAFSELRIDNPQIKQLVSAILARP